MNKEGYDEYKKVHGVAKVRKAMLTRSWESSKEAE